jgi:hypothetical protein
VRVELSDPSLADDLASFLRRAQCRAERAGAGELAVDLPDALLPEAARLELEAYLAVWQTQHPGVRARRRAAYDL